MLAKKLQDILDRDGKLPSYSTFGCYPIFYVTTDLSVLCPDCANAELEDGDLAVSNGIIDYDANWENPDLYCDECSKRIESAYAEPE